MKLKANNGYVGVDSAMALIIILILVPAIAGGIYNISKTNNAIKVKSEALHTAVNIIEISKGIPFDSISLESEPETETPETDEITTDTNMVNAIKDQILNVKNIPAANETENGAEATGTITTDLASYNVTITSKDYSKTNPDVVENKIKTIKVKVEYKTGEYVELRTVLTE